MQTGGHHHYSANTKAIDKRDGKMTIIAIVEGLFECFSQTDAFVSVMLALRSSLCSWCLSLVCSMSLICPDNGDKFYHRKSIQAVNEKLIINELRPYEVWCHKKQKFPKHKTSINLRETLKNSHLKFEAEEFCSASWQAQKHTSFSSLASPTHFHKRRERSGERCIQAVSCRTVQCGTITLQYFVTWRIKSLFE